MLVRLSACLYLCALCSCVAGFICALPSRFNFQIRSLSWTMTETKSGGRQLKGDMAGSEEVSVEPFHSHKNVKKKVAPSLWGQAAASCLKVQRCIQVGAGQKRKTGRCCRIYVEVTEKYVTNPRHSSDTVVCFWTTGGWEELSPAEETLQTDATLPPAAHCSLRHVDARLYLYTFQILQKIKVSNRFLLLQT